MKSVNPTANSRQVRKVNCTNQIEKLENAILKQEDMLSMMKVNLDTGAKDSETPMLPV